MQVSRLQLLQFKAAIKLEKLGLRHSSGRSVTAHVKRMFGLPRNTKHDDIISKIESLLAGESNEQNRKVQPG